MEAEVERLWYSDRDLRERARASLVKLELCIQWLTLLFLRRVGDVLLADVDGPSEE